MLVSNGYLFLCGMLLIIYNIFQFQTKNYFFLGNSSKKRKIDSLTVKVTSHNEGEAIITDLQENEQEDEFKDDADDSTTSIGSLIWGRMAGFPYWPCFVTKSPTGGDFKRVFGKRKEYHAQFFNWNNESGWVSGAMPWCPINEYQAKAKSACPKGTGLLKTTYRLGSKYLYSN